MFHSHDFWSRFWKEKNDLLHSSDDPAHYDLVAMHALLGPKPFGAVLELACGNGALYERLGFKRSRYINVYFSPAIISSFHAAYPEAQPELANARDYTPPAPVDLIYSHGLLQYMSAADIDHHLDWRRSLKHGGQVLHASIPWDVMGWTYYSGIIRGPKNRPIKSLVSYAARSGLRPSMGRLHSIGVIRRSAAKNGFDTKYYGSWAYLYRFDVRMVPHAG